MRTKLLLSTAAVALMLATPVAFAQSNPDKKPEAAKEQTHAKSANQNKQAERKAGENKAAASNQNRSERKSSQAQSEQPKQRQSASDRQQHEQRNSENKAAQESAKHQNAQKQTTERHAKDTNSQHNKAATTKQRSTTGQSTPEEQKSFGQHNNADGNQPQNSPSAAHQNNAAPRNDTTKNATSNDTKTNTANSRNQQNTANVNVRQLTPEKRTQISETISRTRDVAAPVRDLRVSINIGTRVPQHVHLHRVPSEIVSIEPAYREYDYFTTEQDIVIVDPHTRAVVSMIPRDASQARTEVGSSSMQVSSTSGGISGSPPCQVLRREASGETVPVNPEDLARSTTGSGSIDRNDLAVTVQGPNGQTMPPIALRDQTGQIVVAMDNGECKITIEPGAH